MDYTGTNDMTNHEDGTFNSLFILLYILKLNTKICLIVKDDASEDEDYIKFLKKRDDKSDYGKSEDDIIWEGLCNFIDPEIVDRFVTRSKAFKDQGIIINDFFCLFMLGLKII